MPILFRWSVWGDKRQLVETLPYSVGTFRRAFGDDAQYIVFTDEPHELKELLEDAADVRPYGDGEKSPFNLDVKPTWRKWRPTPRIAPDCTEFYVDADVFLVADPVELRRFSADPSARSFVVFREAVGVSARVGRFGSRILEGMPPINTGFLGQKAGVDITRELLRELRWWHDSVPPEHQTFFDDQGAVVAVLARHYLIDQVELLCQDRYCIVSPTSNSHLQNLDGVAAIHTTHPTHPAFHRFRDDIEGFIAGPALTD
jgi:hypothetical protein